MSDPGLLAQAPSDEQWLDGIDMSSFRERTHLTDDQSPPFRTLCGLTGTKKVPLGPNVCPRCLELNAADQEARAEYIAKYFITPRNAIWKD